MRIIAADSVVFPYYVDCLHHFRVRNGTNGNNPAPSACKKVTDSYARTADLYSLSK